MKSVRIDRRGEPFVRVTDDKAQRMNLALCEKIGVDPASVTELRADLPDDDQVAITATVVRVISRAEFDRILNEA